MGILGPFSMAEHIFEISVSILWYISFTGDWEYPSPKVFQS
jgi:hypothetical protein